MTIWDLLLSQMEIYRSYNKSIERSNTSVFIPEQTTQTQFNQMLNPYTINFLNLV